MPANQFVLKVHSRCDLACDHCYVYEAADQSWRGRPAGISPDVISRAAARIAEHAKAHELTQVEVVLHGGEPLLAGVAGLRAVVNGLEDALRGLCRLDIKVHTNGVLLTEKFLDFFSEHGVGVGISLDGDRVANDRHRKYRDGRSSYDAVVRAIRLLGQDRYRHLYAGLLCTIDTANDPIAVYESLLELAPPRLDLLLPHATWDAPPPRAGEGGTDYADWLIAVFDRWQADGCPTRIRTFDSIVDTLAGGASSTEALGLEPVQMVVIETDGSYEQADSLKVAFDGAPATGLDVFTHSLDAVLEHPGVAARQHGLSDLSADCQRCPVVSSCGGGMYAHRFKSGSGFDNRSVYCADLLKLIRHVSARLPHLTGSGRGPGHQISDSALTELAAGLGGADAVGQLMQAQRSLRRGLLTLVYEAGLASPGVPQLTRDRLRSAWLVLAAADRDRPDMLDMVLAHPYFRVWAVGCLERLASGPAPDGGNGQRSLAADLGHFGAVAAAVAIRGQARAQLAVAVLDGGVHLPGLGRLTLGPADATPADETSVRGETAAAGAETWASLTVDGDWVRVTLGGDSWRLSRPHLLAGEDCPSEPCSPEGAVSAPGAGRSASWQPVRALAAPGIRVALEDTDPYRDCHPRPAVPRLSDADFDEWQRVFSLAWQEIQQHYPAYAPALSVGLSTLMPMASASADSDVSAVARQGFGAVGAALPGDPAALALLLIHEFQHVKLGAVLDLHDLYDPADGRLYPVPWRQDPRPLEGLLQGTYAYLAVAEFWRVRAGLDGATQGEAVERHRHWRRHTAAAVETLAESGSLTPLGLRFADQMRIAINAI
jgi:uncharacterized protein